MGSLKWFIYVTDAGDSFAILLDESNTESVNGNQGDYTENSSVKYSLPRNVRPRKAVYESLDGRIRKEIVCLTRQIYGEVPSEKKQIEEQHRGTTLHLRSLKGERVRLPYHVDTGLNDGDAT